MTSKQLALKIMLGVVFISLFPIYQLKGYEVQGLSTERIEKHKKHIEHDLNVNRNVRYVGKGLTCAGILTALVLWYNDFKIITGDEMRLWRSDRTRIDAIIQTMISSGLFANNTLMTELQNNEITLAQSNNGWGSFLMRQIGMVTVSTLFGHFMQNMMTKVFHDQSVSWYFLAQTTFPHIAEQLQAQKDELDNLGAGKVLIDRQTCEGYADTILELYTMISQELEKVTAYMQYRLETANNLSDAKKKIASKVTTPSYFINRAGSIAVQLNEAACEFSGLTHEDRRIVLIRTMFDTIYQFMLEINAKVKYFELIEKKLAK